ncbi:acyl carrier protein [Micromonospora sp. FIMYZ51]|uniref:acyl carrier protein n=1 Tax=Micromonospora sp. FIMYZ51 TaxID=3051832 RepID=UPI00311FBB6A
MTRDDARARVRQFLEPHFGTHELRNDDNLFQLGYVNSLFAMQLVAFVEKEFRIEVQSSDLEIENFQSIEAIARLVEAKSAAAA